jgi:hypothetical protein
MKKTSKKLSLSKQTVVSLSAAALGHVGGGSHLTMRTVKKADCTAANCNPGDGL